MATSDRWASCRRGARCGAGGGGGAVERYPCGDRDPALTLTSFYSLDKHSSKISIQNTLNSPLQRNSPVSYPLTVAIQLTSHVNFSAKSTQKTVQVAAQLARNFLFVLLRLSVTNADIDFQ